jgi:VanZ family protein
LASGRSNSFARYWLPVLIWAAAIFFASTDAFSAEHTGSVLRWIVDHLGGMTAEHFALLHFYVRKAAHVTEYAIFSILVYRALQGDRRGWRWKRAAAAVAICLLYAATDEFHQVFVPSRGPSPKDVAIDTTGALVAQLGFGAWVYGRDRGEEREVA